MNFTSLWLNDTLYMIQWEAYLDKTPNCVALSMGFGLMKPDWFSGGQQYGIFWPAKKTDGADPAYHATLVTVTDAGQGVDLPFSYYSLSENNTDTDGAPFLMHAPSPCVNVRARRPVPIAPPKTRHTHTHTHTHSRARACPNAQPYSPPGPPTQTALEW